MKAALVYSFAESEWFSCTIILKNLILAYEELYGKENLLHIDYTRQRFVKTESLNELYKNDIKKIIFIDHKPTPIDFIKKLKSLKKYQKNEFDYTIHVFGDFPLYLTEWRSVNEELETENVRFICASQKQKWYVEKFLKQKENIFVSPFPVDRKTFNFDIEKKSEVFKNYNITDDDYVYLYTGRLSYQKRIHDLVENFCKAMKTNQIQENSKLLIVGDFDNLGFPYLSKSQIHGEYFRKISRHLDINPEVKDKVIFAGKIKNRDLKKFYNAADTYISLSTYHDEDYGMSVAEALCSGTPAILSNWAGYYSFQLENAKEYCHLVDIKLGDELPHIDNEKVQEYLALHQRTEFDRKKIEKLYLDEFSVEAVAKKLGQIHIAQISTFNGGTEFMARLTNEMFIKGSEIFKLETSSGFNKYYYGAYDVYAK